MIQQIPKKTMEIKWVQIDSLQAELFILFICIEIYSY